MLHTEIVNYTDWLCGFIATKSSKVFRLDDSVPNLNDTDDENLDRLFELFSVLLKYSGTHNKNRKLFEAEIEEKYGNTYMCYDCSVVYRGSGGILIQMIVLELGGASDMLLRVVDGVEDKDVIDIGDVVNWYEDYTVGTTDCTDCIHMAIVSSTKKVRGIDYKCTAFDEMCDSNILSDRVYPSKSCRLSGHKNYILK